MSITLDEIQLNFLGLQYFNNPSVSKRGSMEKAGESTKEFQMIQPKKNLNSELGMLFCMLFCMNP